MPERAVPPEPFRDLDWSPERARAFTDEVVDLWEELLRRLPELPVAGSWRQEDVAAGVGREIPEEPLDEDRILEHLRAVAFDFAVYPGHPRFMAYISGAGTVPGAPADLLAAGLNMNLGGWRLSPSASEIEQALMRWFADRFGLGPAAGGLMTSGGAMATFIALKAARDAKATWDVRSQGMPDGRNQTAVHECRGGSHHRQRRRPVVSLHRRAALPNKYRRSCGINPILLTIEPHPI